MKSPVFRSGISAKRIIPIPGTSTASGSTKPGSRPTAAPTARCAAASRFMTAKARESELDYENIALLGSNLEIFDLQQVGCLNYLCDEYGLDTMSAGCVLSFYADAIDHGAVERRLQVRRCRTGQAAAPDGGSRREGKVGNLLAEGSLRMAREFGNNSEAYAMQVKGLEVAAYNCKFIPGQALAFGVSPIGAHHREAWIITFEIKNTTRESYGPEKAAKVIELQRIRGGMFEFLVACRFPWIELGWSLDQLSQVLQYHYQPELDAGRYVGHGRPHL